MKLKSLNLFITVLIIAAAVTDTALITKDSEMDLLQPDAPLILKVNETNSPKLEWWENAIFYQIYPRSFKDSNGDGVGDLRGVIQKLAHLKEMGVAGVFLGPVFKSPMVDFGYDVSDFYQIDPLFGTNQDLEDLCREAEKFDIKIILVFVPNHSSDQHDWFQKSIRRIPPYTDFYVWHNGVFNSTDGRWLPPNNWVTFFEINQNMIIFVGYLCDLRSKTTTSTFKLFSRNQCSTGQLGLGTPCVISTIIINSSKNNRT